MADHTHQLTRSMQRKWARPTRQLETCFFRRSVTFAVVAAVAASYKILPGRTAAARARNNMIERQFRTGKDTPAELASIAVA
jgi:hypothetical protein